MTPTHREPDTDSEAMTRTEARRIASGLAADLLSPTVGLIDWLANRPDIGSEQNIPMVEDEMFEIIRRLRKAGKRK